MPGRRTFLIGGGCTAFIKVSKCQTMRKRDGYSNILNSPGLRGLLRMWVIMILQNSLGCLTSEQMGLEAATKALLDAGWFLR